MDIDIGMRILNELETRYKDTKTALNYNSPFELLVATMLSAQCTDVQVNKVTSKLFPKYNTPADFVALTTEELESHIKSCGFYKVKSRNIIDVSRKLFEMHNGHVPSDLDDLMKLPGVGRKTANVVLANAFGVNTIAVDTHVFRVANRLGLSHSRTVYGTEMDLMKAIPEQMWSLAHNWLIWHGRQLCAAKRPKCIECFLNEYCEYFKNNSPGTCR